MNTTEKVLKTIISVAVVIALIAVIFIVVHFTNGNSFTYFYVTNGSTEYLPRIENKLDVTSGQAYYFTCNYTISGSGYAVKIVANVTTDFEFFVDGLSTTFLEFCSLVDLTGYFDIEHTSRGFVLYIPQGFTVQTMLNDYYTDNTVTVPVGVELGNRLTLEVTPNNAETVTVNLVFRGLEQ